MFWNKEDKPYIKFHTHEELLDLIPHPVSAAKAMPEWFRKLKPVINGHSVAEAGTIKRCIPVLDAVSQGYIIPLWADLHVKVSKQVKLWSDEKVIAEIDYAGDEKELIGKTVDDVEGTPKVTDATRNGDSIIWMKFPEFDMGKGELISGHNWQQVGNACDLKKFKFGKTLMKFTNPWIIETAPGWSVQFKNPANNFSNDIQLLEGVVDTDTYYNEVNFPYVWTGFEEGEWIIPRGTPLVHAIPFKRSKCELEVSSKDSNKSLKVEQKMLTKHFDRYKSLYWNKRKEDK